MCILCIFCVLYSNSKIKYHNVNTLNLLFIHIMITKFTIRNNSTFLYLTQAMLQLLHIDPENTCFIFTHKNKVLYISVVRDDKKNSTYVTKIRRTGSGWSIPMTKSLLEFIEVNPETDNINLDIENETIILKKYSIDKDK